MRVQQSFMSHVIFFVLWHTDRLWGRRMIDGLRTVLSFRFSAVKSRVRNRRTQQRNRDRFIPQRRRRFRIPTIQVTMVTFRRMRKSRFYYSYLFIFFFFKRTTDLHTNWLRILRNNVCSPFVTCIQIKYFTGEIFTAREIRTTSDIKSFNSLVERFPRKGKSLSGFSGATSYCLCARIKYNAADKSMKQYIRNDFSGLE